MGDRRSGSSFLPTTVIEREKLILAPYAMHSAASRGRVYEEAPHPYRGPFQRDRDRVVHSSAFRRLSGKMQVFTGDRGDYHRTRLTHTMEVASIARTIGRALSLNEDLIEALALLHDIGHPPFGHAGEDALHECLADAGGFSHNRFALTIVQDLEHRYHRLPGLNLTHEVLEGQLARIDKSFQDQQKAPLLEVQVVDAADSIAYNAHDLDDALKLGLVQLEDMSHITLVTQCMERVERREPRLSLLLLRSAIVHELIDVQVSAVVEHCRQFLASSGWQNEEDVRRASFRVGPDPRFDQQKTQLHRYLYEQVYRHPDLISVRRLAQQQLHEMFEFLCQHPDRMPEDFQRRTRRVGLARSVADYLAGMTDRFCQQTYHELIKN